ncbi:hypothetical protein DRH27_00240 [Candidatus Falkowbacteria bacterium]|nr:MAG: hypothetical protein DRH27_00240 [Candidatus Falkowbacteria bacterium]
MDKRKEVILNTIIKEHIKTGAPVGSSVLVEKYKLNISSATVRNEMASLEDEEYIIQPHTSAGRIPTEKAYNFYLNSIKGKLPGKIEISEIEKCLANSGESGFKETAKLLSRITGNAVFWAFHRHNLFYTGISNLFQQPEFSELEVIYDISAIIDRIDEIINSIFEDVNEGVHTMVGSENPFGDFCGTVIVKYKFENKVGLFGMLGPIRMDYEKNIALARFISGKLK